MDPATAHSTSPDAASIPTAIILDTNIFLSLAAHGDGHSIVNAIVDAVTKSLLVLYVPDVIVDEFTRRKDDATTRYWSALGGRIRDIGKYRDFASDPARVDSALEDLSSGLAARLDQTPRVVSMIDSLITTKRDNVRSVSTPDDYYAAAAKRIRNGAAPGRPDGTALSRSLVNDQVIWLHALGLAATQPVILCSDNRDDFCDYRGNDNSLMTSLAKELGTYFGRFDFHNLHGFLSAHFRTGVCEAHIPMACITCGSRTLSRESERLARGSDFEEFVCAGCGRRHATGHARD